MKPLIAPPPNLARRWLLLAGALLLPVLLLTGFLLARALRRPAAPGGLALAAQADLSGFARADGPRAFSFPQDHGPHPDYQTEWWYYTGNLSTADGRRFGYQLTFFRRALVPPTLRAARSSDWAADQAYMAHFALTDVAAGQYHSFERLQRGAAGLAGAQAAPFDVWLDDWQVSETAPGSYHLIAKTGYALAEQPVAALPITLDLLLSEAKGPILQGDQGYSQKGPATGQASYYYSLTRLESSGVVRIGETSLDIRGYSWMDHEFSTSALSLDQVGWDWFSFQLDNNTEIMVFQIRKAAGQGNVEVDPYSSGTIIYADGTTRHLSLAEFSIETLATWRSPRSGATYPARWRVRAPSLGLDLEVEPYLADQELNVSYSYWEGAVQIRGQFDGQPVSGSGYVEMTGYSGSMGGEF